MFIKYRIIAGISACVLAIVCFAVFNVQKMYQHNKQLTADNKMLTAELKTLQENYRITEEAYKALSETQLQISTNKKVSVRKIKSSPKRHNAPIAPVLIQVLEVLP